MSVENHSFRSSAIESATYDSETQQLNVLFQSGKQYIFDGFPPDLWEQFKASGSAGRFYNDMIRGSY